MPLQKQGCKHSGRKKNHDLPRLFVPIPVILPDFELTQLFPTDSKHQNQITLPKIDSDSLHGLF